MCPKLPFAFKGTYDDDDDGNFGNTLTLESSSSLRAVKKLNSSQKELVQPCRSW